MSVYLDASAVVPLFIEEARSVATQDFFADLDETPAVSDFGIGEVVSALSLLHRAEKMSPGKVATALAEFDEWRVTRPLFVECLALDIRVATEFVRRFDLKLRMPDALHLAIGRRLQLPIFTFDVRMITAAAMLGIEIAGPSFD